MAWIIYNYNLFQMDGTFQVYMVMILVYDWVLPWSFTFAHWTIWILMCLFWILKEHQRKKLEYSSDKVIEEDNINYHSSIIQEWAQLDPKYIPQPSW